MRCFLSYAPAHVRRSGGAGEGGLHGRLRSVDSSGESEACRLGLRNFLTFATLFGVWRGEVERFFSCPSDDFFVVVVGSLAFAYHRRSVLRLAGYRADEGRRNLEC